MAISLVFYSHDHIFNQDFTLTKQDNFDYNVIKNEYDEFFQKIKTFLSNDSKRKKNRRCNYIRVINRIKTLNWGSKDYKNIIWVASNPVYGPSFSIDRPHQVEDQRLTELLQERYNDNFYFFGFPLNKETKRTFNVIQSIFNEKYKSIEDFTHYFTDPRNKGICLKPIPINCPYLCY